MDMVAPGVGFVPSEKLIVGYYLVNKNNQEGLDFIGSDMIREVNLYAHDPFELSFTSNFCFESPHNMHFYCFTAKVEAATRRCKSGFWVKKGNDREITVGVDNVVLGKKSLFFFYIGNSPITAVKTEWAMYEYTLANNPLAPFVVCRVFDCPHEMDLESDQFGLFNEVDVNRNFERNAAVPRMNEEADAAGPSHHNVNLILFTSYQILRNMFFTLYRDEVTTEHIDRTIMEGDFIELADLS